MRGRGRCFSECDRGNTALGPPTTETAAGRDFLIAVAVGGWGGEGEVGKQVYVIVTIK